MYECVWLKMGWHAAANVSHKWRPFTNRREAVPQVVNRNKWYNRRVIQLRGKIFLARQLDLRKQWRHLSSAASPLETRFIFHYYGQCVINFRGIKASFCSNKDCRNQGYCWSSIERSRLIFASKKVKGHMLDYKIFAKIKFC